MLISQTVPCTDPTIESLRSACNRASSPIELEWRERGFRRVARCLSNFFDRTNPPYYIRCSQRGITLILRSGHVVWVGWDQIPDLPRDDGDD